MNTPSYIFQCFTVGQLLNRSLQNRDIDSAVASVRAVVESIQSTSNRSDYINILEEIDVVVAEYEQARLRQHIRGITLGWDWLDNLTQGAKDDDVIFFVGRPSVGKSMVLQHVSRMAWLSGKSVLFGSMEMEKTSIARRLLGMQTGINPKLFTTGQIATPGRELVRSTLRDIEGLPPYHLISGSFKKTVHDIDALIRELRPDICFIDASYLLSPTGKSNPYKSRRENIADVAEGLKEVARNTNTPIVGTVQFNRTVKRTSNKMLDIESIGETDVIGQIASVVVGIQQGRPSNKDSERILTLIKNRDGEDSKRCVINYLFSPVNFDHVCDLESDDLNISENPTIANMN